MKEYGAKIAELRASKNMTQAELGAMLNVTSQAVSKWENGLSEPDMDSIRKLCEIFEISFDEFFGAESKSADKKEVASTGAVVLAYCDVCDKPLYNPKEYQVSIENGIQHTTCLYCVPKKEEMKRKAEQEKIAKENKAHKEKVERERKVRQEGEMREIKKGLVWGAVASVVLGIIFLVSTISSKQEIGVIITGAVIGFYGGLAMVSQFIWVNSVWDVFGFFLRTLKLPGVIFTLDIEGILFLITVKLLGAILSAIFSVVLFIIGIFVTLIYAMIIFPFALIKEIREAKNTY